MRSRYQQEHACVFLVRLRIQNLTMIVAFKIEKTLGVDPDPSTVNGSANDVKKSSNKCDLNLIAELSLRTT